MNTNPTRTLIHLYGYSFERLAVRVNCSFNSVKNWYRGTTKPHRHFQMKLNEILAREKKKVKAKTVVFSHDGKKHSLK